MLLWRPIRVLLWLLVTLIVAAATLFVLVIVFPAPLERWLQDRVVLALRQHYGAEVTLQNLQIKVAPVIHASADNLVVANPGDPSLPPLISVKHFTLHAPLPDLLRTPVHITDLKLEGLEIRVGPKRQAGDGTPAKNASAATAGQTQSAHASNLPKRRTHLADFVIDKVEADGTKLYILRKDPSRAPLLLDLRKLELRSAGTGQPMKFTAELTNPKPPGLIQTSGHFGPWNFDDSSATPLGGHYTFQDADLSVFNGISGTLSSVGDYSGVLRNIAVDGATDTPDFKLDNGSETVHLTTTFHAIVDGTNGNTYLQPVKAHFLNSDVVTTGEVTGTPGQKGKTLLLDVNIQRARVQDVLALAVKSEPALTGALRTNAKVQLPPGKEVVLQRLKIEGNFQLSGAHFTNDTVKKVVLEISRRGQGRPGDNSITDVPAELAGDFLLKERRLNFARLQFMVPGAEAQFKGAYGLGDHALNFAGDVRLHATISEMVGGDKGWLLFPLDAIFMRHGAGTWLPMTIDGTREHPQIQVQWGKLFGSG
jgi:uncharacterized protein involved in outer membrane biogenesis